MKDRIAAIIKALLYGGLDKKGYEEIRQNIDKKNYDFLLWLTRGSTLILSALTICSVFFNFLHEKQLFYLIFCIFSMLFYIACRYVLSKKKQLDHDLYASIYNISIFFRHFY